MASVDAVSALEAGGLGAVYDLFNLARHAMCCNSSKSKSIDETRVSLRSLSNKRHFKTDAKAIAKHDYRWKGVLGLGTFGVVFRATRKSGEIVAIKRQVLEEDDTDLKETELQMLAHHRNIVDLKEYWVQKRRRKAYRVYMVLDYMPSSLEDYLAKHRMDYCTIPVIMIKIFTFQMFRGLNYLHGMHIVHRDVKPPNLLINVETGLLKICDFGCAKLMKPGGRNRTYVCSRYYRAPELVLKNHHNDEFIDIWAGACVLAECFRSWPLFLGKNSRHQFGAIANVLGNPTGKEARCLNPSIVRMDVKNRVADGTFSEYFPDDTPEDALDLLSRMLVYVPKARISALDACAHEYYDELRQGCKTMALPSGEPLPLLFDFTAQELRNAHTPLIQRLLPRNEDSIDYSDDSRSVHSVPNMADNIHADGSESDSSEQEETDDVFSEPVSSDEGEECDQWDVRKVRLQTESTMSDSMDYSM